MYNLDRLSLMPFDEVLLLDFLGYYYRTSMPMNIHNILVDQKFLFSLSTYEVSCVVKLLLGCAFFAYFIINDHYMSGNFDSLFFPYLKIKYETKCLHIKM